MSITRTLLASDLDGTLIPLEAGEQHLRGVQAWADAVRAQPDLMLAYVTGRHLALAQAGVSELGLPLPNWFVCDVGTSVYRREDRGYVLDEAYRVAMREALGGLTGEQVRHAVAAIEGLELQEEEKQAEFKVSYYTARRPEAWLSTVEARLDEAGAQVSLVASFDPVTSRGLLDVLPAGVAKDYAVRYLHDHTGIDEAHLVYAGDSGNDRAAMLAGYRVIVVGNADPALKKDLERESAIRGLTGKIYFASASYAAGVLEGLRHFRMV